MKDISATLRRIDDEINGCRQRIAALRVRIGELEDSRLVFMGIAEADQAARAAAGGAELLAPGSHARPQLIVRATGSGDAVNGKPVRLGKKRKRVAGTKREALQAGITAALADGAALTSTELAEQFGLPEGNKPRHPLREALRAMADAGRLDRVGEGRNYVYRLKGDPA